MRYTFGPQLAVDTSGDSLTKGANLTGGTVWLDYAQTTRVTDLQLVDGTATATVDSDSAGWVVFKGPDGEKGPMYVDFGAGPRTISSGEGEADTNDAVGGTGLTETIQDVVGGALISGYAMNIVYDDTAGTYKFDVATGTSTGQVPSGPAFASAVADLATAAAEAALAHSAAREPVTYIATAGASAGAMDAATSARTLPASGSSGWSAALKTALEGAGKNIKFLHGGETVVMDADVFVGLTDGTIVDFNGLTVRVPQAQSMGGNSGQGALIIGGAASSTVSMTGLPTTIVKGIDTIAHTVSGLPATFPVGSWGMVTSTQVRNSNRPLEYFAGEIFQVMACTTTSLQLATATRDSYTTSLATFRSIPMVTGVRIKNLTIESHPSATTRQNPLVIRHVAGIFLENVVVRGVEVCDGVGVWGCVGGYVQGKSYYCQDRYGPGVQGYGLRVAGSEGISVDWEDERSRHGVDLGQSSSSWPCTRNTKVVRVRARHTYAAGFAIHDAEFTHTDPGAIWALNCGGGIIVRGSYTKLDRPVIIGGQAETYPWGAGGVAGGSGTQATTAGITVGERTKLNLTTFDDTSAAGLGGLGLEIIDPYIDLSGATGDFDGISIEDPLKYARIWARIPIKPRRTGFRWIGDTVEDSDIDVSIDHTTGSGSTGSYGPPSGTTYSSVSLTGSTGTFDTGGAVPAVGTELISTGGTPASNTPAGWGGFVPGATYFVYSTSGTTFKVASRKSGNTASLTFTQDLTNLSFIVGQRVHSAYIVPSVSSVNAEYIRRSRISITSTGCRDTPVVIGGARNAGTSYRNRLEVTVTSLGTGPTATTPVVRWVGTSIGEWSMGPVEATPHYRSALHAAYTGLTVAAGGPTLTYDDLGRRSRFLDGTSSLALARLGSANRQRPGSGGKHTRDYFGSVTATALVVGDLGVVRAFPVRVIDRLIGGITIGVGTVPVLNTGTYLRYRMAVFADSGDGNTPTTTKLADLGTIDLVTGSANTARTLTLGTPLWDGAWDTAGTGVYHLAGVPQADGTAGSQVTTFPTIPFPSNVAMSDPADVFTNVSGRGWSSSNTQLTDAGSLGAVSAWNRDSSPRAMPFLLVDSTTPGGMS